jgi:TRAP-type uncharacterized transport system fused permease subunit
MITLSPEGIGLLMIGAPLAITITFVSSCLAIAALAVAFGGWLVKQASIPERVMIGMGGLALLYADVRFGAGGLALLVIAASLHLLRVRRAVQPLGT